MYVVAGVSGKTGAVVADTLLRAGKPVRVVVRDAAKGAPWRTRGAEVAVASLGDEAALARALEGAAGAYLLSPQDMRSPDPIAEGWRLADAIARALERSPVAHLVLLSSIAAHHAEGTGISQTLHAAEERLAEAPARITFLRSALFLESWGAVLGATAGGKLPTFIHPERPIAMVSTRDVGAAAARALSEGPPAARREVVELRGPRDYSPRDLASVLTGLLGRPVEPAPTPLEAVVPILTGLGVSAAFAEQVRLLYQGIEDGKHAGGVPGARSLRGSVEPETVFRALLAAGEPS